jgi:hypothetical protein
MFFFKTVLALLVKLLYGTEARKKNYFASEAKLYQIGSAWFMTRICNAKDLASQS